MGGLVFVCDFALDWLVGIRAEGIRMKGQAPLMPMFNFQSPFCCLHCSWCFRVSPGAAGQAGSCLGWSHVPPPLPPAGAWASCVRILPVSAHLPTKRGAIFCRLVHCPSLLCYCPTKIKHFSLCYHFNKVSRSKGVKTVCFPLASLMGVSFSLCMEIRTMNVIFWFL